jgi:hypothetical protein
MKFARVLQEEMDASGEAASCAIHLLQGGFDAWIAAFPHLIQKPNRHD